MLKLTLSVDDNSFLTTQQSIVNLFKELQRFEEASGCNINSDKTEGMILGVRLYPLPFKILWNSPGGLKVLGIAFSRTRCADSKHHVDRNCKRDRESHRHTIHPKAVIPREGHHRQLLAPFKSMACCHSHSGQRGHSGHHPHSLFSKTFFGTERRSPRRMSASC